MKLDDALAGVVRLGFDTAPFIYFIERHPKYVDVMREVIRRIDSGAIASYGSALTLTEAEADICETPQWKVSIRCYAIR